MVADTVAPALANLLTPLMVDCSSVASWLGL
jgi:hypothetical protein